MTTVTEPPLIDEPSIGVDEQVLPCLDHEPQCELLVPSLGIVDQWDGCPEVAVWRIRYHSGECGHGFSGSVLACDSCIRELLDGSLSLLYCPGTCGMAVYIDGVMRL